MLELLAVKLVQVTGTNMAVAGSVILRISAALSAILDNVPFVATMIPLIKNLAPAYGEPDCVEPLWGDLRLSAIFLILFAIPPNSLFVCHV